MALEQFRLDGQVAIVTGAGRGVGAGIAKVLAEAGVTVVGTARTESEVTRTIEEIKAAGGNGLAIVGDVTNRADNERVVETTIERFGRVDTLVNNAGDAGFAPFLDVTDDDLRAIFDLNVTSAFVLSQLVAPHMLKAGRGSIVNISSGAARFGVRGLLTYCVAKAALESLTRSMAQELAPKIRVNAIALGTFETPNLLGKLGGVPGAIEQMNAATPLHRMGDVADVGRLTVYLCTPDCYATNVTFRLDGGVESSSFPLALPDL